MHLIVCYVKHQAKVQKELNLYFKKWVEMKAIFSTLEKNNEGFLINSNFIYIINWPQNISINISSIKE